MPTFTSPLRRALLRVRAVFFRCALDDAMQAEMREHLERASERYVAGGMSPADARLAAKREFGNLTVIQEEGRDARGARWIDALAGDARFAFRYFARHKGSTAIIIAVIALATGGNTFIFSNFQAYFLRPAPAVPQDPSHVRIWAQERATRIAGWQPRRFTQPELTALALQHAIFRDVAAWTEDDVILESGDSTGARAVGAQFVTPNFFPTLGVALAAGQRFAPMTSDASAPDMSAVMSYATAERLYGSAGAALGRRIMVNKIPVHVIGVAPERFQGALRNMNEPALWMPLSARADIARISPRWLADEASLSLFGRLAPGATPEQATAFARSVVAGALPDSAARVGLTRTADVLTMWEPPPAKESSEIYVALTAIAAMGVLILLIGWMNVSSLMVAAAVSRRHEIAVRLSLGASRARLLRQLVTESTLLALVGSAIGLTMAWWVLVWSMKTEVDGVNLAPDVGTFAFVLLMALSTGILFGLSPALHATRSGVANALRDSGAGTSSRSRLQRGFVIAQIALSQPLLVLLGTMLSLAIIDYKPLSPEMSHRVIAIAFHPLKGTGAADQRAEGVEALIPRIAERPEVVGAVPDATGFDVRGVVASHGAPTIVNVEGAAPGWFAVVGVPILLGRDVSLADTATTDWRVVIGSDLARTLWGSENPIGRSLAAPALSGLKQDSVSMTVVGVYDASRRSPAMTFNGGIARGDKPVQVYTAHGKQWQHDRVLVRARGPAEPFVPELRRFIRATAPSLPVTSMLTLAQNDERMYKDTLKGIALVAAGGALALLLASLGLYGVISLAVNQRAREIGIRIAVGAEPMRVARMFLVSGLRASVVALALGLPLSIVALKIGLAQGMVIAPDVNPYAIGLAIALVLLAVSAAATWVPARRAALVDPARTLRVE